MWIERKKHSQIKSSRNPRTFLCMIEVGFERRIHRCYYSRMALRMVIGVTLTATKSHSTMYYEKEGMRV